MGRIASCVVKADLGMPEPVSWVLSFERRQAFFKGGPAVDVTVIYQIAGLGIIIAILNIFLSQAGRGEQAQMLSLAGVIIVLVWLVRMIAAFFNDVESVFQLWR